MLIEVLVIVGLRNMIITIFSSNKQKANINKATDNSPIKL